MNFGSFHKELSLVTELGLNLLLPVVTFLLVGRYIVDKFDLSRNWLLLVILLGLGSGFYLTYKTLKKIL